MKNVSPVLKEAHRLYCQGFAIHWLHPRSKRPIESGWTKGLRKVWTTLEKSYQDEMNVGVRLGTPSRLEDGAYLAVIDCDVKSTEKRHADQMKKAFDKLFPTELKAPTVLSGRGNGSLHVYVKTAEPATPRRLIQSSDKVKVKMGSSSPSRFEKENLSEEELKAGIRIRAAWEISIMGQGQQVVLPPSIHPDSGKAYRWGEPFLIGAEIPLTSEPEPNEKSRDKIALNCHDADFKLEPIDLISAPLPNRTVDQILTGEGVEDRSAALFSITGEMVRAGFTDNQILTVLTDPATFLGSVAYEHAGGTRSRARAARWIRDYTLSPARREHDASIVFDCEVETVVLSKDDAVRQKAEIAELTDWRNQIERGSVDGGARPKNTLKNVILILQGEGGVQIFKRNDFANSEHYGLDSPWGVKAGVEISDMDTIRIKRWFANNYRFEPSDDRITQAVSAIADINRYHPVRDYLDRIVWDGRPRIDTWLKDYLGASAPEPYLSAISRKVLCAMIARVYIPGIKFDHVLILEGVQGVGKSTALRNLASDAWFTDAHINVADKDAIMAMRSIWLVELGELSGIRSADAELLKEFISRTTDRIRVPYGRRAENFPRQCIFIGSTNRKEYLKDQTGNRRFWPVEVGACDFEAIKRDRDQLLAEAKLAFELGEPLYLEEPEMTAVAIEEQEARTVSDSWEEILGDWLASPESEEAGKHISKDKIQLLDLFSPFGPLAEWRPNQFEMKRASDALRRLGYEKRNPRMDGTRKKVWMKAVPRPVPRHQ